MGAMPSDHSQRRIPQANVARLSREPTRRQIVALFLRRHAPHRFIAMRKTAEACDQVVVQLGVLHVLVIANGTEQVQRALLVSDSECSYGM